MASRILACAAWTAIAAAVPIDAFAQDAAAHSGAFALVCEMRCSDTRLRSGVATITWSGPRGRAGAAGLAGGSAPATVDVTVVPEGFQRGDYVSFDAFAAGTRPRAAGASARPRGARPDPRSLRAYDLSVGLGGAQSGDIPMSSSTRDLIQGEERVTFEIENVEPGLYYQFRLRPPGAPEALTVTCVAPICPADMQAGEEP